MTPRHLRRLTAACLVVALAPAACGGEDQRETPADQARKAVRTYLRALRDAHWTGACRLMTTSARRDVADAAGGSCAQALAGGAALPADQLAAAARELPGARVRIRGKAATIGPLAGSPEPLRLQRVGGRWLVAG